MSQPSNWALPPLGKRLLTPRFIRGLLAQHTLSKDCFPTAMGFYPAAAGHTMVREQHDDNLLMLVTEGAGKLHADGQGYDVGAGDVVLLPAGVSHRYRADTEDPWTLYWVHFAGAQAADLMHYVSADERRVVHPGVQPGLVTGFQQLLAVERTGYSLGAYITAANRLRALITLTADLGEQQRGPGKRDVDLDVVQQFMREQVAGQLTLEQLAASAGLSRSHFAQRYRDLTGYAPMRHFTQFKMEAACHLLDTTQQSIKQVAAALGYDDPLYFSRVFRRVVGVSPRAYRQTTAA